MADSNAAIAAASVAAGAAGDVVRSISVPWAITIDVIVVLLLLAARVGLLWFLVDKLSGHTADVSVGRCAVIALVMAAIFAAIFTSLDPKVIGIALLVSVLIGSLLCKVMLWMSLERGLYACLIYLFVSGALGLYSGRGLDYLLPGRATITGSLAGIVDDHVRKTAGDPTLPPSASLHEALGRLSISTNENPIMSIILSPLKAEQKLKNQIAGINQLATENARLINELSGGGTNVSTRKQESAKLRESMNLKRKEGRGGGPSLVPKGIKGAIDSIGAVAGDEAAAIDALSGEGVPAGGSPQEVETVAVPNVQPLPGAAAQPEPVPRAETTPPAGGGLLSGLKNAAGFNPDTQAAASAAATPHYMVMSLAAAEADIIKPQPAKSAAASQPGAMASVQFFVPTNGASAPKSAPAPKPKETLPPEYDPFAGLSASNRAAWNNSATGLVVTSVVRHHGDGGMAMVNGEFVHVGEIVTVSSDGRAFQWRMVGITNYQSIWEPILEHVPANASTGLIYRL